MPDPTPPTLVLRERGLSTREMVLIVVAGALLIATVLAWVAVLTLANGAEPVRPVYLLQPPSTGVAPSEEFPTPPTSPADEQGVQNLTAREARYDPYNAGACRRWYDPYLGRMAGWCWGPGAYYPRLTP